MEAVNRLRTVLYLNAVTSGTAGLVAALVPGWTADLLGTPRVGIVRAVGVGLVVFAVESVLVARWSGARLAAASRLLAACDATWTAGVVVLVVAGSFDSVGSVLMLGTGLMTAVLAWWEWRGAAEVAAPRSPVTVTA